MVKVSDVIIYLSIAAIFIWALLKSLGIINTPVWVEMIPFFGIAGTFGGFIANLANLSKSVGKIDSKLDGNKKELDEKLDKTNKELHKIDNRLSIVETRVGDYTSTLTPQMGRGYEFKDPIKTKPRRKRK